MIWSRLFTALVFVMCTACGAEEETTSDNWWEQDGGGEAVDTGSTGDTTGTTDKPDDKPDDTGDKPEDDGEKDGYTGQIDTDAGTGTFSYERIQESGENCNLSYPVLSATAVETCEACSFAWTLELGEVTITNDAGGCGYFGNYSNTSRHFGQGSSLLAEYEGINYYYLYESEDGSSWTNNGGFSWNTDTSWSFGSK